MEKIVLQDSLINVNFMFVQGKLPDIVLYQLNVMGIKHIKYVLLYIYIFFPKYLVSLSDVMHI